MFGSDKPLVFGAADTTITSRVKSENKRSASTPSATTPNNIIASATTNSLFRATGFAIPTTSTIGSTTSVTTTSANTTTAPQRFGEVTTISNGCSLFGIHGPTATTNSEFGARQTLFGLSSNDSNQRLPLFADHNQSLQNNMLEEALEFKKIGQLGAVMSSYIWKISHFSDVCKSSEKVILCVSPLFKLGGVGPDEKKCKMYLYPCGTSTLCKEYVSIYIECQSNLNPEAQISFSILDANLQITNETFSKVLLMTRDHVTKMGCSEFVKRDMLLDSNNGLLSNDTLTIGCHVSLRTMDDIPAFPSEMKINKDFGHLLESGKFSDLILEVEDKELKVHKSVLAARSPTFHKMLDDASSAANEDQNKLKLTDIKYDVMKQILRFIYTEKVDDITQLTKELLVAAERFKLEDLKMMCGKSLFKNLNVTNVIDTHVLAEAYDSKWLKDRTTDFIIDNAHRVIKSSGYKNLADSHPHLLDELLREIVRRKVSQPIEASVESL